MVECLKTMRRDRTFLLLGMNREFQGISDKIKRKGLRWWNHVSQNHGSNGIPKEILLRNDGFQTLLILGTHFPDGVLLTVIFNPAKQFLLLAMEAIKHYLYIAYQHLVGRFPGLLSTKLFFSSTFHPCCLN